jgi:diguanylate cyclase (GGDEF)-like protein/PAS domain S-box-containing protein
MSPALLIRLFQIGAALAIAIGLVAVGADWDAGKNALVPAALVALALGVFMLTRALGKARLSGGAEAERLRDEREARTRQILDRSHEAYVAMDDQGRVTAWNATAETMFGWSREEALGRTVAELIIPDDLRPRHTAGIEQFLETGKGRVVGPRTELTGLHRDGSEIPVELSVTAVDEDGHGTSFHGFLRDITERKLLEVQQAELLARAEETARVDALTALPNRRAWDEELERELARAKRTQQRLCIALLDLDHFKVFNDTNGHQAGDRLLRRAGSAWRLAVRASDFVARYGGEEFAVLLPDCPLDEALDVIERLREVTPEDQTVSAGLAEWNRYESAEALIDRADFALYQAKRGGRNRAMTAA